MTGSTQTLESGERTGKAPQAGCLLGNTNKSRGNYILAKQVLCGIRKAPRRVNPPGWEQGEGLSKTDTFLGKPEDKQEAAGGQVW